MKEFWEPSGVSHLSHLIDGRVTREWRHDLPTIARLCGAELALERSCLCLSARAPLTATACLSQALSVLTCVSWMCRPHVAPFPNFPGCPQDPPGEFEAYENSLDRDPVFSSTHTDLTNLHLSSNTFAPFLRRSSSLVTSTPVLGIRTPQISFRNHCKPVNPNPHLPSHKHTS